MSPKLAEGTTLLTLYVYSAVFQAGGLVVVLVEVSRKAYLASIVPVIVNAILNDHQILIDIVAFVNRGDFPRSRLGEKQRGKILAGWVSRKMRTVAQFAIKDMDAAVSAMMAGNGAVPAGDSAGADPNDVNRVSMGSQRGSVSLGNIPGMGSSLRNVETAPQIPEHLEEDFGQGPVEMPANEQFISSSIGIDPEQTPTKSSSLAAHRISAAPMPHGFDIPDFNHFGAPEDELQEPPPVGPKPGSAGNAGPGVLSAPMHSPTQPQPQIRLPAIDGRESLDSWDRPVSGLGLVRRPVSGEGEDWTQDAYMSMNLAGTLGRREN